MKFKNTKKNKNQSPSNSRTIPAFTKVSAGKPDQLNLFLRIYRGVLKVFITFIFILAVLVVGLDLRENLKAKQTIDSQREKFRKELVFWESFIQERKNYRDAYFQASVLEYKLGDREKAKMYAEKGLALDPNSQDGRKIEEFLNK